MAFEAACETSDTNSKVQSCCAQLAVDNQLPSFCATNKESNTAEALNVSCPMEITNAREKDPTPERKPLPPREMLAYTTALVLFGSDKTATKLQKADAKEWGKAMMVWYFKIMH